jgi:2,3-bisphosphoglycerate-dependent phosphoglycerate mutase
MSEWVAGRYRIGRVYSSTLIRARQTAEFLSAKTRALILLRDELMEFDNGLLAGLPFEEAKAKYPKVDGLPIHSSVYQMEPMLEFRFRAEGILSEILSDNDLESTVALVSHGGMITQLYRAFLYLPVCSTVHFSTGDTGVHLWKIEGTERRVLFSNSTAHLKN